MWFPMRLRWRGRSLLQWGGAGEQTPLGPGVTLRPMVEIGRH